MYTTVHDTYIHITHAETRPGQYRAVLFICMLFMLIILLPWIHPVTDQHPTCIATNISHCFMATALIPYSLVTHAIFVVVEVNRLEYKQETCSRSLIWWLWFRDAEYRVSQGSTRRRWNKSVSLETLAGETAAFLRWQWWRNLLTRVSHQKLTCKNHYSNCNDEWKSGVNALCFRHYI